MSRRLTAAAFFSGLIFAVGLGVSGMTQPSKVLGFLDPFGGAWDPSLGLVMAGAIAVHLPLYRWMRVPGRLSVTGDGCGVVAVAVDDQGAPVNPSSRPDRRLMVGAGLFGLGWGLAGYCPGPAIVSLVRGAPGVLLFVAAMIAGMMLFQAVFGGAARRGDRNRGHANSAAGADATLTGADPAR